jgi:hypothetical protein
LDNICAITTIDNPFDPFDNFSEWFMYDISKGYNTCAYLGRVARTSDGLSDAENEKEIEDAIDEIIALDVFNMYKKITKSTNTD